MNETNQAFYFTYAANNNPFYGGWTKVYAPNLRIACEVFSLYHPAKHENLLNCADVYSENEFKATDMYKNNQNLGFGCHEVINIMTTCETSGVSANRATCPFLGDTNPDCSNCPNGTIRQFDAETKTCKRKDDVQ